MKPAFHYNGHGVKSSSDMYRNIRGVHYSHYTSDPSMFDRVRVEAKSAGKRVRVIKGEMFVEFQK